MENKDLKKNIVKMLKSYFQNRIQISDTLRFKGYIPPIFMDEYNEIYVNDSNYAFNKYIKINNQELDTMFMYIEEYLMNREIADYPSCSQEYLFITKIFEKIVKEIDKNHPKYQEVLKYLHCLKGLKNYLIDDKLQGRIDKTTDHFYVYDNLGNKFISYSKDGANFVKEFYPVLNNHNLAVINILDHQTAMPLTIIGLVRDDYYLSLFDNKKYLRNDKQYEFLSFTAMDYFLKINNCSFLQNDIYSLDDVKQLYNSLLIFNEIPFLERLKLTSMSIMAASWIINEYLADKEMTIEQEQNNITILGNMIKRKLLENNLECLISEQDIMMIGEKNQMSFNLLPFKMTVTLDQVLVERNNNIEVIYQEFASNPKQKNFKLNNDN